MNFMRDATVALDTNTFIFALRREANYPNCERLLFDRLSELHVYLPLQVLVELQRNLVALEMRGVFQALMQAKTVTWNYAPAPVELIQKWLMYGAKKGDAVIIAHLEAAGVRYLISENRHFLVELPSLPFQVLTSTEAIRLLE